MSGYLTATDMRSGESEELRVELCPGGTRWAVYRHFGVQRRRLTSSLTPPRDTPEECERDLALYCAQKLLDPKPLDTLLRRYQGEVTRLRYLLKAHCVEAQL